MATPVKVLLVSTHPVQYNAPLYRRYAADDRLDVTVAYCSLQGAETGLDPEFGVEIAWDVPLLDGYRWVNLPNRSPRPGLGSFWGFINPQIWTLVRKGRFDVVVCYGHRSASFWIAALAAKMSRSQLVWATDAIRLGCRGTKTWKTRIKRLLLPAIVAFGDAVLVPSLGSGRYMKSLGVSKSRILYAPYVVDNEFFEGRASEIDQNAARRKLGLPEDAFIAVFVGKLVDRKRPSDLLEAAGGIDDAFVLFAGDGPLRSSLIERAEGLGMSGRVRFLGFVNQTQLPATYAACDVLVLPSENEPFGLVVNEAFACGRTALVSDACGAAGELVRPAETGFVFPVGDTGTLKEQLKRLAGDRHLLTLLSQNAHKLIERRGPTQNAEAFAKGVIEVGRKPRDIGPAVHDAST